MLKRAAIFTLISAVCFAGDAGKRHKELASQPTPRQWHAGAIWRFVTTAAPGKPQPPTITLRITDDPATSCSAGGGWKDKWRRLAIVEGKAPLVPIYQVEGRALQINVTGEICDAYDFIDGVLSDGEFKGSRATDGLGAPNEHVGTVRGFYVEQ
jgi:hypothetical protein